MPRHNGRPSGSARRRAMRFALWARAQPTVPTPEQIAQVLDICLVEAREWRHEWLDAISPANPLPGERDAHVRH
ncbi:MAG: hypothetical protein ACYCZD_12900 [Rhodanobacter sp.]